MSIKVQYLVVGQGLAGTLVANFLLKRGRSVMIIDKGHDGSSSQIAAGIINPVTGRRFVKSWMFDELIDVALECYGEFEREFNIPIVTARNIIRKLPDQRAHNDWMAKSTDEDYDRYILPRPDLAEFKSHLDLKGLWSEVTGSYQIDIPKLIAAFRKKITRAGILRVTNFDIKDCILSKSGITYRDVEAEYLILSEGASLALNDLFAGDIFLNPSKGEILKIKIPGLEPQKMIKRKYFLTPLEKELFWFGAKDGWHFSDNTPSTEGLALLTLFAKELITVPFEIVDHLAAIRPTIKDRRPVIGPSLRSSRVFLFNGLGTKGASLGPFWAGELIRHIEEGIPLPEVVDPNRFFKDKRTLIR
ncbi:MAG: FAD-binding oxidoreductase [Saprospiraceae bacterium]|nr:FAD-binding oxidoreductase [Saprospiraceae bacterium]